MIQHTEMKDMKRLWPLFLTIFILVAVALIAVSTNDHVFLGNLGSMLSGVSGAIAFVWLIAAFLQQKEELSLQRNELRMQREALELQRVELGRMSRQAALTQVSTMMANFNASLSNKSSGVVRSLEDIHAQFVEMMPTWKVILEATDPQTAYDSYRKWSNIEGLASQCLAVFANSARFYEESTGAKIFVTNADDSTFIIQNADILKGLPHLQQYFLTVFVLAQDYLILQPGIRRVRLAGWMAMQKLFPNAIDASRIDALRKEINGTS